MVLGIPGDLRTTLQCGECGEQFRHTFPNETFGDTIQVGRVVVFPHRPCYEAYMRKTMFTILNPAKPVEPMAADRFLCRVVATQRPYKGT